MKLRKLVTYTAALSFMIYGLGLFSSAVTVPLKAWLSVNLIEGAWARTLEGEAQARPWPWMDSHPVAQISVPGQGKKHIVMSGVSGAVMAFAPGWHDGTAYPGGKGISLISAHKDTHFDYLKNLDVGTDIEMLTSQGDHKTYRIEDLRIVDSTEIQITDAQNESLLVLSTCYPFSNWQVGGKMRFVVIAREIPPPDLQVAGL